MKEVLRVLAAVGETLPDVTADAEAEGATPETAPSSASVPRGTCESPPQLQLYRGGRENIERCGWANEGTRRSGAAG